MILQGLMHLIIELKHLENAKQEWRKACELGKVIQIDL